MRASALLGLLAAACCAMLTLSKYPTAPAALRSAVVTKHPIGGMDLPPPLDLVDADGRRGVGGVGGGPLPLFRYIDDVAPQRRIAWSITKDGDASAGGGVGGQNSAVSLQYAVVSPDPKVIWFPRLATDEECDQLVDLGKNRLSPSGTWRGGGGSSDNAEKRGKKPKRSSPRTSSGVRLDVNPLTKRVSDRILAAFHRQFSGRFAERLQLLRYEQGQRYTPHIDSFGGTRGPYFKKEAKRKAVRYQQYLTRHGLDPAHRQDDEAALLNATSPDSYVVLDRALTVLLYVSNVTHGGNTSVPYLDAADPRQQSDYRAAAGGQDACDPQRYFQSRPRKGAALAFYSLRPDGTQDGRTVHAGCPVVEGTKYVITKWMMVPLRFPPA